MPAVLHLPFGHVLRIVRIRIDRPSRFEDESLQIPFRLIPWLPSLL